MDFGLELGLGLGCLLGGSGVWHGQEKRYSSSGLFFYFFFIQSKKYLEFHAFPVMFLATGWRGGAVCPDFFLLFFPYWNECPVSLHTEDYII